MYTQHNGYNNVYKHECHLKCHSYCEFDEQKHTGRFYTISFNIITLQPYNEQHQMSESDKCFTINYLACMKQCFDSFIYHNYKHLRDNNYIDE